MLRLIASYAYKARKHVGNRFGLGEGLVGQAALEKKPILLTNVPDDYIQITSGLGEAPPRNIIVLPDPVRGRGEGGDRARVLPAVQPDPPDSSSTSSPRAIGVVLNMISANMRTEELLEQSQKLTQELQSQSEELQQQQEELKRSNSELEAQAKTLRAVRGAAQGAAGRAAAGQRGAGGEGLAARRAEPEGRAEEPRGGGGAARARGEGGAARAQLEVQERVPGEHDATSCARRSTRCSSSRKLLSRQQGRQPHARSRSSSRRRSYSSGTRPAQPDQRHARPVEGRGRQDGGERRPRCRSRDVSDVRRAHASGRWREQKGLELQRRRAARRAADDLHRRPAAAAGAQEPAVERVQVHRAGQRHAHRSGAAEKGRRFASRDARRGGRR